MSAYAWCKQQLKPGSTTRVTNPTNMNKIKTCTIKRLQTWDVHL